MSSIAPSKPRRRWPRVLAALLALVLVGVLVTVAWYFIRINQALSAVPRVDFDTIAPQQPTTTAAPSVGTKTTSTSTPLPELAPTADPFRPQQAAPKPTGAAQPGKPVQTDAPGTGRQVSEMPARPAVVPATDGVNFLLLGTDFADGGVSRSDAFMILHLNADRKKAYIISFPRDMYVPIPGYGNGKINWAFQWGGTGLAKRTAEQLTGVGIEHTAHVDFERFIRLTDALGGVTINNPYAFEAAGYSYPKGQITISGEEALVFVRQRYQLPRGDLDRAANQRAVVKAIIASAARPEVLANPVRFNSVLSAASNAVEVDSGLTDAAIRDYATSLRFGNADDIVLLQAPISGFGEINGGDSIDVVDWGRLDALKAALRADDLAGYVARYGKR